MKDTATPDMPEEIWVMRSRLGSHNGECARYPIANELAEKYIRADVAHPPQRDTRIDDDEDNNDDAEFKKTMFWLGTYASFLIESGVSVKIVSNMVRIRVGSSLAEIQRCQSISLRDRKVIQAALIEPASDARKDDGNG